MQEEMRFGIVGTGLIADVVGRAIEAVTDARLAGVASRRRAAAEEFAAGHGSPEVFDDWRSLVASDAIDAVYVATPTSVREEISVAVAANGKHLLADKPFASLASLAKMTGACREAGVAFMDATHFSHHPRTRKIRSELPERIGRVQAVRTCFFFPLTDPTDIRFDPEKEPTGAVGDMAWYSMRAIAEFMPHDARIERVSANAVRDAETDAVVRVSGHLAFDEGRSSTFDAGYDCGTLAMDLDLLGERGMICLDDFVLDWAGGFAFDDPSYPVGFTERSGIVSPGGFERVGTPSERRAAELMIAEFVRLAREPAGEARTARVALAERTQSLLDAVWSGIMVGEGAR